MSYEALAIIVVALALGGIGKAITGFGLPLFAIPVMAPFLGVEHAVIVLIIPATVTNLWLLWEHRGERGALGNPWPTLAAGLAGVIVGTWLLSALDERVLALLLAGWIGFYLMSLLFDGGIRIPPRHRRILSPAVVMAGGISQGAMGISGPLIVPYLNALRLTRGGQVFAISMIFAAFGLFQLVAAAGFGLITGERLIQGGIALIPVVATMAIGIRIARRVTKRVFDVCVVVLLAAMGVKLAWQGIFGA